MLDQAPASFQVESPHGRRSKIKARERAAHLRAARRRPSCSRRRASSPTASTPISCGNAAARASSASRTWRANTSAASRRRSRAAGVLLKLHSAPMYFYRRGQGRFQAAPEETLKLALAAAEKKKRVQEQIAAWAERSSRFECPPEIAALKDELLYAPDRNKPRDQGAGAGLRADRPDARRSCSSAAACWATATTTTCSRFLHEFFPRGAAVPGARGAGAARRSAARRRAALSASTTSAPPRSTTRSRCTRLPAASVRIGIHIAAPALGFAPGSPLDAIARERLRPSTCRGASSPCCPRTWSSVSRSTRAASCPAVSLYLNVDDATGRSAARHSRLERVPIAANLRHAAVRRAERRLRERRDPRACAYRGGTAHAVARRRGAGGNGAARPSAGARARLHLPRRGRPRAHRAAQARRARSTSWCPN